MICFKSIELSDKKVIDACLAGNTYRACDFCFTNLYSWQAKFKTTFAVIQETLFIRYREVTGELCYMMPIGRLPLSESLKIIVNDASGNNIPFIMKAITERMWNDIQTAMPDTFQKIHDRDNDAYIYLSERLRTLTGKKLQSKRNHINRFKLENPDWNYFRLTNKEDLDECSAMLDKWENMNLSKAAQSLRFDYIATKLMLEHFNYMQLCGGALRVNGGIVAFTIGERLTDDTFVIHVEKALAEIHGAYTMINQQFSENETSAFTYVNREEDMGLEYLRKAKKSYYPDILLEENILLLK